MKPKTAQSLHLTIKKQAMEAALLGKTSQLWLKGFDVFSGWLFTRIYIDVYVWEKMWKHFFFFTFTHQLT